jgi:hypothetical protein
MPEERLHREPGREYAEAHAELRSRYGRMIHEAGLGESLATR